MPEYDDDTSTEHIGISGPMDYPLHAWLCQQTTLGPTNVAAVLVESKTIREAKAILGQREAEDLVVKLQDMIAYAALHVGQERYFVSKLRTFEKELFADAKDAWQMRLYADDPKTQAELTPYDRWWRN